MSELFLIDVHSHLQDEKFAEDIDEVVKRANGAGVKRIVNAGTSVADSRKVIEIANRYPGCLALIGIHPHDAASFDGTSLDTLRGLAAENTVVGIGEIGIDFHYDFAPRELQIEVFKQLWLLAAELEMPAVIHVREAYEAFFAAIKGLPKPKKVMLHCFSGDLEIARAAADLDFHFSIGGALTFPKSDLTREVFKVLPADRIHLETDCPYLAPQFKRGKRNEPAYLVSTLEQLAKVRKLSVSAMADTLKKNALSFFGTKAG